MLVGRALPLFAIAVLSSQGLAQNLARHDSSPSAAAEPAKHGHENSSTTSGETTFTIDLAMLQESGALRYHTGDRVRVTVTNMNPFAADYRIVVRTTRFENKAIELFLSGIGITAAHPAAPTVDSATVFAPTITSLVAPGDVMSFLNSMNSRVSRSPPACGGHIRKADALYGELARLDSTLDAANKLDLAFRRDYASLVSPTATRDVIETTLNRMIAALDTEATLATNRSVSKQRLEILLDSAVIVSNQLKECGATGSEEETKLATYTPERASLVAKATWWDAQGPGTSDRRDVLNRARSEATSLYSTSFSIGDYDDPTHVDIEVSIAPVGGINAIRGLVNQATAPATPQDTTITNQHAPAQQTPVASDSHDWRMIASPRLHFGERRQISVGGAVVYPVWPQVTTRSYQAVRAVGDTLSMVSVDDYSHPMLPLLTLNVRLGGGSRCGFYALLGASPTSSPGTVKPSYFAGIAVAGFDERVGLTIGALSTPVTILAAGFSEGDKLNSAQAAPPTRVDRKVSLAAGVSLRP